MSEHLERATLAYREWLDNIDDYARAHERERKAEADHASMVYRQTSPPAVDAGDDEE